VHASAQGGPPLAAEASWEVLRAPHGRVTALAAANDGNHLWSGSSLRNPDPFQGLTAQLSAAKLVSIMAARCTNRTGRRQQYAQQNLIPVDAGHSKPTMPQASPPEPTTCWYDIPL